MSEKRILISNCLLGEKCAYDGEARTSKSILKLSEKNICIPVCPELSGGLGCPREKHEILEGSGDNVLDGNARVFSVSGEDHTEEFVQGAEDVLKEALDNGASIAVLKTHSPSCGKYQIYSGKFDGKLHDGSGVAAALLKRHGIKVFTEKEIENECTLE